jgi:negative regulator of flagellin synthesis FlgM
LIIDGSAYVTALPRLPKVNKGGGDASASQGAAKTSTDRIEISPKARELVKLKQDLAVLPDVRLDRVALAKQEMRNGGYQIDPSLLAQKIMDSFNTQ